MIAKPNSEISGGRPYILQATFLARGQRNNVFGITGKSGMNIVVFAHPKTGKQIGFHKEILTKVASISVAFETAIVVMTSLTLLCYFETRWCKQFFEIF